MTVVTSQRPNACVNSSSTGKRPVVEYVGESQDINSLELAKCITVTPCDSSVGLVLGVLFHIEPVTLVVTSLC